MKIKNSITLFLSHNLNFEKQEGIVCRVADEFHYDDFQQNYAKAVRKGHVQTDEHWMEKVVVPNKLKNETIIYEKIYCFKV
jgi:hypothetical protein